MARVPMGAVLVAAVAVAAGVLRALLSAPYRFSPEDMAAVGAAAVAASAAAGPPNATRTVGLAVAELRARYPGLVRADAPWMLNNAGGAMGAMQVLHFSAVEYVIIFGTAVGTEGHSGRFWADDYFTILHGEQWAFSAGGLEKEVFRAGEMHVMPAGTAKQYRMPDECWALEYARGNILSMLPFGLGDTLSSTFDFVTLYQTLRVASAGALADLARTLRSS